MTKRWRVNNKENPDLFSLVEAEDLSGAQEIASRYWGHDVYVNGLASKDEIDWYDIVVGAGDGRSN